MRFSDIIQKVNSDKRLVPDLLKSEKGNNFRAVSESAILDVISPILESEGIFYTIDVRDYHLDIREAYGAKGKKLQFIATVSLAVYFRTETDILFKTDSVGMGIDDNDKAMGKAYTYALKYALLKLFRLRYGDDPDAKASDPLLLERAKEVSKKEEDLSKKETKSSKSNNKDAKNVRNLSEAQRDYILGMMEQKGITSQMIMGKFNGYDPKEDEIIPMTVARAMIKWLEDQDNLPF